MVLVASSLDAQGNGEWNLGPEHIKERDVSIEKSRVWHPGLSVSASFLTPYIAIKSTETPIHKPLQAY